MITAAGRGGTRKRHVLLCGALPYTEAAMTHSNDHLGGCESREVGLPENERFWKNKKVKFKQG